MKTKISMLVLMIAGLLFAQNFNVAVLVPSFFPAQSPHPQFQVNYDTMIGRLPVIGSEADPKNITNIFIYLPPPSVLPSNWAGSIVVHSAAGFKIDSFSITKNGPWSAGDSTSWNLGGYFHASDTAAPVVTINSISPTTLNEGDSATINYTVTDNSGLVKSRVIYISYDEQKTWKDSIVTSALQGRDTLAYDSFSIKTSLIKLTSYGNQCVVKIIFIDKSGNISKPALKTFVVAAPPLFIHPTGKIQSISIQKQVHFYDLQGRQIIGKKVSGIYIQINGMYKKVQSLFE
jgi:hypothetical protein